MSATNVEPTIESLLEEYVSKTIESTSLLYESGLYGHLLIIIYSSIDTFGLLVAPPSQTTSTGQSFKDWVNKYMLSRSLSLGCSDVDLWGARCSVLHTFTSESDLSNKGKAKELVYYGGDKNSNEAMQLEKEVLSLPNTFPINFDELYQSFISSIMPFVKDAETLCSGDANAEERLRKVLQMYKF